jgi:hypothetical protein
MRCVLCARVCVRAGLVIVYMLLGESTNSCKGERQIVVENARIEEEE